VTSTTPPNLPDGFELIDADELARRLVLGDHEVTFDRSRLTDGMMTSLDPWLIQLTRNGALWAAVRPDNQITFSPNPTHEFWRGELDDPENDVNSHEGFNHPGCETCAEARAAIEKSE
jgi:hypothetical protein